MIVDDLAHAAWLKGLPSGLTTGLNFLRNNDLSSLADGRQAIDGERVFAIVQGYETRPERFCRWEAHRRHFDIQVVVRGSERVGVASLSSMSEVTPYHRDNDVAFFEGTGDWIMLKPGRFALFSPHDVHCPGVAVGEPEYVRKVVVKVAIAER